MTHIEPHISKGQFDQHLFSQVNVAANQAAVALTPSGVAGAAVGLTAPFDGAIVSMTFDLSVAGTVGVFTIDPTVNATAKTTGRLTVGTATKGTLAIGREAIRFVKGDVLGVKITTDGSWDGTTGDVAVLVGVLYYLAGI